MSEAGAKKLTTEEKLKEDIKDGGITLVLGAGINSGSGLPDWNKLLSKLGSVGFEPKEKDALSMLKTFEQLGYQKPGGYTKTKNSVASLKQQLYSKYYNSKPKPKISTLEVIGQEIIKDRTDGIPKIRRVITLNVDSLLEEYILKEGAHSKIYPHPITQWYQSAVHVKNRIDIYHLHGFLPTKQYKRKVGHLSDYHDAPESLVFGDDEYWDMTSRPSSLPNVVMMNALHDSHCVFIGLSMTDPNIARWLALRANEIKASKRSQKAKKNNFGGLLSRHYWIEADPSKSNDDNPEGKLEKTKQFELTKFWLKSRGVRTIRLNKWKDFSAMFEAVFQNAEAKR